MKGKKNMLSGKTIWEHLTGHSIAQAFIQWLKEESEEFSADHQRYIAAMKALREELGDTVTDEINAIEQQCASDLLFSGFLGLKANLDHFMDPVARNFLDVDFDVYLREETAHRLPEYERAEKSRDRFYSLLSPVQQKIYEDVITYTSYLETVGPKLAHYYGYLLGNELLPRIVPGYHKDSILTARYTTMLENYFGIRLDRTINQATSIKM